MKADVFEMISFAGAAGYLVPCAVSDLRKRGISLSFGIGGCMCAALWMLVEILSEHQNLRDFAAAGIPGAVLMGFSILTGGGIGLGDGVVLLGLGFFLGFRNTAFILLAGLILASFWSAVLVIRGKAEWKFRIPWIPFLLAGYVAVLLRNCCVSWL